MCGLVLACERRSGSSDSSRWPDELDVLSVKDGQSGSGRPGHGWDTLTVAFLS